MNVPWPRRSIGLRPAPRVRHSCILVLHVPCQYKSYFFFLQRTAMISWIPHGADSSQPVDQSLQSSGSSKASRVKKRTRCHCQVVPPPFTKSLLDFDNHPLARQQIEHAPKDQRHQRAAQNDDIVRHRKIGGREIDEERGRVHALRDAYALFTRRRVCMRKWKEYRRREVPASHRVGWMLGVLQKRLA